MKLLHVTPYIHTAYGGPSVAVRSMAEAMLRQGAEVHVAVTNAAGQHDLPWPDGTVRNEGGVVFHYFRRIFPRGWFRAPGLAAWLQAQASSFDVLHLHVPFTAPFRAAALAARASGRPYVATPHGVLDPWSLKQKAWKKRPYLRWLERDTLGSAAALHVTAPLEAACVADLQLGPTIHCLPLGVPCPLKPLVRHQHSDVARVLSIARLHPVKALPVLFAALARLRAEGHDVFLDLAGQGEAAYVAKLRQQAQSLGLEECIAWHGHVDAVQKERLYAVADCFALLSYHENFGLAAAEAMGAGVPVVVSDQVGLAPDVLAFQAGIVVPTGDDAAAAQALRRLLEPAAGVDAGVRAHQLVQQRYGETAFAEGLAAMYQAALSNG